MVISVFDSVGDIVGREENAGHPFSRFPTIFSKAFHPRVIDAFKEKNLWKPSWEKEKKVCGNNTFFFYHNLLYPFKDKFNIWNNIYTLSYGNVFYLDNINSLPNDKIFDWSKLKTVADDKINMSEKFKICFGKGRKIVGKGENAGDQSFLPVPLMLSKKLLIQDL